MTLPVGSVGAVTWPDWPLNVPPPEAVADTASGPGPGCGRFPRLQLTAGADAGGLNGGDVTGQPPIRNSCSARREVVFDLIMFRTLRSP